MDFYTFLLFILFFNAVFKEPTTNSRNSADFELPYEQYENSPDYRESLTADDAPFPDEADEPPQQYEELYASEEYANLDATDTMNMEMEDKDDVQVDTTVTMPDQMEDFYQEYYESSPATEQLELESTGPIQTEQSTTTDTETPLLQIENMPDDTSILQIDNMPDSPDQYEELHVTKEHGNIDSTDTPKVETETKEYTQLDTSETMSPQGEGFHQHYYEYGVITEQVELATTGTLETDHNTTTGNNTSILQTENLPWATIITIIYFASALAILLSTAIMIASIWIMLDNSINCQIIYKMKCGNAKSLTIEHEDTVDI